MLSATPVNQRMNDLKNQIAFITEGNPAYLEDYGIQNIDLVLRKAQGSFNSWFNFPEEARTIESLQNILDTDYFKLLEMLTIARSRKHIQKYYDTKASVNFQSV